MQVDMPVPPGNKGMELFLHGLDDSVRQTHRDQLFAVTRETAVDVAQRYAGAGHCGYYTLV